MAHPSAESINPMQTLSGGLADYLTPGTFGGRRAGRATAMARAVGEDPSFNLRHPQTSDLLWSLPGAAVGAAAGVGAGMLAGGGNDRGAGPGTGALVGAGAGALLASIIARVSRRGEMADINEKFDKTKSLHPTRPGYEELDAAGGFGGSHRMGQIEALKAMTGGKPNQYGATTDAGRTLAGGTILDLGGGIGQGINAMEEEKNDPKIRKLKVANVTVPDSAVWESAAKGTLPGAAVGAGVGLAAGVLHHLLTKQKQGDLLKNVGLATALGAGAGAAATGVQRYGDARAVQDFVSSAPQWSWNDL